MNGPGRTIRRWRGPRGLLALALCLACAAVRAEPVSLEHDDLTLLGYYEPPPAGAPVVLMLHGTLAHGDMEIMSTLREVFAEEGWGALSVSLSFGEDDRTGMYPCDSLHRHLITDAAGELAAWRAWLTDRGVTRVVLLGHSRGALQMAAFAADAEATAAEALVLLAPPAPPDGREAERYGARFDDELAARVREVEALVAAGRGDETLADVGFLYCEDARVTAAAFLSYYGPTASTDIRPLLEASPRPVLVIAGSEDEISAGLPAALGPVVSPPRRRLVEIDGADHFFRDLYAYDVVEAVQGFVDETAGP